MWDELIENFDMTLDKEDIARLHEIKAIETLKSWKEYNVNHKEKVLRTNEITEVIDVQETILNLIEILQEENEELKEYIKILGKKNKILKHLYDDCCICLAKSEEKLDEQRR